MGKWTFDKELQDTSTSAAGGVMAGAALGSRKRKANADTNNANADAGTNTPAYSKGGYVGPRASGKRDYGKGKR
jgi:hypothetical protein